MNTIYIRLINMVKKPLGIMMASWLMMLIIQWALINLYTYLCVPLTWWGIFTSAISLGSPLCHFVNTIQYEITKNYILLWSTAATATITWIIAKLNLGAN
jgi:hypothetical protein